MQDTIIRFLSPETAIFVNPRDRCGCKSHRQPRSKLSFTTAERAPVFYQNSSSISYWAFPVDKPRTHLGRFTFPGRHFGADSRDVYARSLQLAPKRSDRSLVPCLGQSPSYFRVAFLVAASDS
jgi:hypothetical protein